MTGKGRSVVDLPLPRRDRDLRQENRDLRARMEWMAGEIVRLQVVNVWGVVVGAAVGALSLAVIYLRYP
jgi:hypothetical protein